MQRRSRGNPRRHRTAAPLQRLARIALATISGLLPAACADAPAAPRTSHPATPSWTLEIVAGDRQVGEVGVELPIAPVVRVVDASGRPGVGWAVTFRDPAGGTVTRDSTVTDAGGFATGLGWTLGETAGEQSLHVMAAHADAPRLTASLTVTARAGAPAVVHAWRGDGVVTVPGAVVFPVEAYVTDRFGNRVPDAEVRWTVVEGGGRVDPAVSRAVAGGMATAAWQLGDAVGRNRLEAAAADTAVYFVATTVEPEPLVAMAVATGRSHSCGLTPSGEAFCWGRNDSGALGIAVDPRTPLRTLAARVRGNLSFSSIAAGGTHTCATTAAGIAHCWGANWAGQLGDGSTAGRDQPTAVEFDAFSMLTAGDAHTCGLTASGLAYCWGDNTYGQLGDGTTSSHTLPARVVGVPALVTVAAGGWFTCGVSADGVTYCWGDNAYGQLAGPSAKNDCGDPWYWGLSPCSPMPQRVTGYPPFVTLAAGPGNACGIAAGGEPHCWGVGVQFQLPVRANLTGIAVGNWSACGLTAAGEALCWPMSPGGGTPQRVGQGLSFASLDGNGDHFCGVSESAPSIAYCWGSNAYGQLGDGATQPRDKPDHVLWLPVP